MNKTKDPKKVAQGKRNRAAGAAFEKKVREDLISKGWNCSKFGNNVQADCKICNNKMSMKTDKHKYFCKECDDYTEYKLTKQIPASPGRFRMMQTGFPDFICYKKEKYLEIESPCCKSDMTMIWDEKEKKYYWSCFKCKKRTESISRIKGEYTVQFVEAKTNGYLSAIEREKARWYLENNICSKFLIAKKIKNGRKVEVEYKEFVYN